MVTNLTPTTISTPPPGGGSGFTMDESAMDTLQHQADDLRTGYQEVSSALSGQTLAGNAFGTAGTFAAEAFNASTRRSVELAGKAASTLGLVGDGLKATAQTHLEADRASVEQFAMVDPAAIADAPQGAPAGGPNGTPTTQGPPVTPTQDIPGGSTGGGGGGGNPSQPPVTPTQDIPGANGTTQASNYTGPDASAGQAGVPSGQAGGPSGQGGGAPTGQPGGIPTGQMPPMPGIPAPSGGSPTMPPAPAGTPSGSGGGGGSAEETKAAAARTSTPAPQATTPTPAPIPDFPEIPDPPPVPTGSGGGGGGGASLADALKTTPTTGGESASGTKTPAGGTTPSANTTPPPTPPIPEVPKDLFKQPTIPDLGTGSGIGGSTGSGTGGGSAGGSSPSTPSATTPSGGMTPPPMPSIPEVPKDLFKQPTIPDLGTPAGTGTSGGSPSDDASKPTAPPLPDNERPGRDREDGDHKGGDRETRDREGRDREASDREGRDREGGEHGGGGGGAGDGGEDDGRTERDQHGFPITSVDDKPCLDLRDLPAEEGERWQEKIRDIIATKGEGSFFWAGDTIDAEGQRHSLMDLAEFMTNLDSRTEPTGPHEQSERQVSDTVAASPARSANGDVFVLVGPNRAEGDPVELTDFPTLQANPRVERVFAIDALTGKETQIHPKTA
ncbi:hypothetical protein ADK67_29955 [Saccharothrix sp. NRRL B-16348]|uniref:hypothetical protein n=1 Tax=Saccharothrix sp. NRRL B-16348 TaxID=1415542 RepID=UPI0006ADAB90|nr:hypothetical protein [Saccharothrix sp. NRRL B-16348]KOX20505.1 hypothetical protein ADK67_29955 [Saccharothrix sp. NRRL B-16348]